MKRLISCASAALLAVFPAAVNAQAWSAKAVQVD